MKIAILLFSLFLFMNSGYAQKKKKNPYDDYWKQQEQEEKFDALVIVAHELFQKGELEKSKEKYQEALPFKPNDQETIAKIKDISILLEKNKILQSDTGRTEPEKTEEQDIPVALVVSNDSVNLDTGLEEAPPVIQKEIIESNLAKTDPIIEKTVPIQKIAQPKENTESQEVKIVSKETEPTLKNTTLNYQSQLGKQYPEGWTEEITEEKTKTSVKRVFVKENIGNEYVMVKHHYGAIYYFKNGKSISYATWSAETSSFKESK